MSVSSGAPAGLRAAFEALATLHVCPSRSCPCPAVRVRTRLTRTRTVCRTGPHGSGAWHRARPARPFRWRASHAVGQVPSSATLSGRPARARSPAASARREALTRDDENVAAVECGLRAVGGVLPSPKTRFEAVEENASAPSLVERWQSARPSAERTGLSREPLAACGCSLAPPSSLRDARKRVVGEIDVEQFDHAGDARGRNHVSGRAQREDRPLGRERNGLAVGGDAEVDRRAVLGRIVD